MSAEGYIRTASKWADVPDSDITDFKNALFEKYSTGLEKDFKCAVYATKLHKDTYTIQVGKKKFKLSKEGFEEVEDVQKKIEALILEGKNTFVKDAESSVSYNVDPDGKKEMMCGGGMMFVQSNADLVKNMAWDELNYHYMNRYGQFPNRFVIVLSADEIEVYDKNDIKVGFKKCTNSQEAYGRDCEVFCDISGDYCTDESGKLLEGQEYFYHSEEGGKDLSQKYDDKAKEGIVLSKLVKVAV